MANKKGRAAAGAGSIRKRKDGRWEGRFTYEDELGTKRQCSVYASTQRECRIKLSAATKQVDEGRYKPPQRMTVAEWMDAWLATYCSGLKQSTAENYRGKIERYIKPNIGDEKLQKLSPMQVQKFCNRLRDGYEGQKPLSAKSVKNVHGILHSALKQAVLSWVIDANPADNTKLPKVKKPELKPLMDDDIPKFLQAIAGHKFEALYVLALFSGLRESEILGLQWDDVNFESGQLTVRRQLQRIQNVGYVFSGETKSGKERTVPLPPSVVKVLQTHKRKQTEMQLKAGPVWDNPRDLVFTDEIGGHLKHDVVYRNFKRVAASIGIPGARFHDLRHSCAILSLQAGCSIKAVQEQLGHYSSAFTMDVYAAVSEAMKKDTQDRMEALIQRVSDL